MTIDLLPPPAPEADLPDESEPLVEASARPLARRLRAPALTSAVLSLVLVLGDKLPSVDGVAYFEAGRNLLSGKGYTRQGRPELHFPPLAPVSLGLLEKLTGSEMAALRIWNFTWGLAVVALVVALAHRLSRDNDVTVAVAWVAGTVAGLVPTFVRKGGGSEAPATAFLLGAALLAIVAFEGRGALASKRRSERRRLVLLAGAGALVGLAYLARPESLLPGALIGLAAVWVTLRDPGPVIGRVRTMVPRALAFGAALLLFVVPYLAFLHGITGSWSPTAKSQDASIQAWKAVAENDRLERDRILYAVDSSGISIGRKTKSLPALAREDPSTWLEIVRINASNIGQEFLLPRLGFGPDWVLAPAVFIPPALALLWRQRRRRPVQLLAAMAAGPLLTCLVFFTQPRYLVMATALLVLFGTWGMVEWSRTWRPKVRTGAWLVVGVLIACGTLTEIGPFLPGLRTTDPLEQRTAGVWIADHTPEDARIMTRSFHVQAYAKRTTVALPSTDYVTMMRFARRLGVSYVVADESTIARRRPELSPALLGTWSPPGLKLVHQFVENGQEVRIYRLDPPAPSTDRPPLPLGYVSDGG